MSQAHAMRTRIFKQTEYLMKTIDHSSYISVINDINMLTTFI